jgi:hypothetical protein
VYALSNALRYLDPSGLEQIEANSADGPTPQYFSAQAVASVGASVFNPWEALKQIGKRLLFKLDKVAQLTLPGAAGRQITPGVGRPLIDMGITVLEYSPDILKQRAENRKFDQFNLRIYADAVINGGLTFDQAVTQFISKSCVYGTTCREEDVKLWLQRAIQTSQ